MHVEKDYALDLNIQYIWILYNQQLYGSNSLNIFVRNVLRKASDAAIIKLVKNKLPQLGEALSAYQYAWSGFSRYCVVEFK